MNDKKISHWIKRKTNPVHNTNNAPTQSAPSQGTAHSTPAHGDQHLKNTNNTHQHPHQHPKKKFGFNSEGKKMRVIPLGGLEEVGKNIMAIEYGKDIIVIDCGMSFAGPEMLGVDYIVPDVTYLAQRKRDIKAVIFTHGHLDHIGAAQYILPQLGNPLVYATKLTAGLLKNRLREFGLDKTARINEVDEKSKIKAGAFEIEFFRVNHSIPDGVGVFVKSPAGTLVHTGDFKFDHSPAIDKPANMQRIAEIGAKGIDVLMIDSTNATKPGFCTSEKEIANNLEEIVSKTKGRLIIASFSSLIGRINQICNIAIKYNRKVFLSGRSMIDNMKLAEDLGYTTFPKDFVKKISPLANSIPPSQSIILTTGAQGETLSALTRMAIGEHAHVKIREGDTVVISASPIPGNELAIVNVINNLYRQGAKVITSGSMDIHTSGHAHKEEIKLMYSLIKPKCYVPIHGELYMRAGHAEMMRNVVEPHINVTLLESNGDILEIGKMGIRKSKQKIPANDILIDGLGFGDIGSRVIQDRKVMSENGLLVILFRAYEDTKRIIAEPDIISRGFLYVKESQEIAQETKKVAHKAFEQITNENRKIELKDLKIELSRHISRFIRKRLGREPMIIPIIMYT
ncbi:ribonuclease J [Candidatus Peregrinibacteria bacterium]|nr:ribonuclease J [Candidatus Peregrinibacteria bacterium]